MALGTVTVGSASKFHAERSGREIQGSHGDPFRAIFCFQLRPPILANIFVLLTPINQGYPPPHGQHSTLFQLKNSSLWWSTTSWLCGISHTNRPPGVGDHFCCPQHARRHGPLGWGITLVDGGHSRQRDKQYAPMFLEESLEHFYLGKVI